MKFLLLLIEDNCVIKIRQINQEKHFDTSSIREFLLSLKDFYDVERLYNFDKLCEQLSTQMYVDLGQGISFQIIMV